MRPSLTHLIFSMFLGFALFHSPASASLKSDLEPLLEEFARVSESSGTLLVERAQEEVIRSFGLANDSTSTRNSEQTIFGIGSLSKQVTATAILRLIDQKLLELGTPVTEILPELPAEHWKKNGLPVTIHHLLSHTAGTPDAYSTRPIRRKLFRAPISIADILASIRDQPMRFPPGARWEYSNTGYLLLGEVVRRCSGKTFQQFMRDELLHQYPSTSVGRPSQSRLALSYTSDRTRRRVPYLQHHGIRERHDGEVFTDGNIYSTVGDLKSWVKRLSSEEALSREMTQRMFTPVQENYGYGWHIYPLGKEGNLYSHSGSWIGYTSDLLHIPEKQTTLVWLRNQEGLPEQNSELLGKVLKVLLKR